MQMMGHLTAFLAWSLIILGLTQGREVLQGMNRCKVRSFVLITKFSFAWKIVPCILTITLFIQPFVFPLDQGLRNVASDGNFPETWDLETGQFLCINI